MTQKEKCSNLAKGLSILAEYDVDYLRFDPNLVSVGASLLESDQKLLIQYGWEQNKEDKCLFHFDV